MGKLNIRLVQVDSESFSVVVVDGVVENNLSW